MKEKLLKYDIHVRRKPMLLIATTLDLRFKLGHILRGEHKFVMKTLCNMLELVCPLEASRSTLIDDLLALSSHKCSKLIIQFLSGS